MGMLDRDLLEEFKARLKDRFTAVELCELLELTEDDILDSFEDRLMELHLED